MRPQLVGNSTWDNTGNVKCFAGSNAENAVVAF